MSKITDLTAGTPAGTDPVEFVDVSDTTMAASGTNKQATAADYGGLILLETITNSTAGEFDFNSLPSVYNRFIIHGNTRGDAATTEESLHLYFNEDLTDSTYHRQHHYGNNNAASASEASTPRIGITTGASSPTDSYGQITIVVENPAGSYLKQAISSMVVYRGTDDLVGGKVSMVSEVTAAITRIRIRTDNHATDQLLGTLRLYGQM